MHILQSTSTSGIDNNWLDLNEKFFNFCIVAKDRSDYSLEQFPRSNSS